MIKFLRIIILFLLPYTNLFSQKNISNDFVPPLNIPLFLSGNYGELRTGHFHAGIDLKTQGVKGKPVFAAYEGYVSRIKIQSGGYGNALYITHPNGYTTVYGHLDRFIPSIQQYVEKKQYEKQQFEIELFPNHELFVVKQGEVIAYTGNTGRSGGPHLHFEIRKSNGQVPLNGLRFNLPVADNIPPVFNALLLYNMGESNPVGNSEDTKREYRVIKKNDTTYQLTEPVLVSGNFFGLGVEVYDYLNGSFNRCGVYTIKYFLDDEFKFGFTIDNISFTNTRYINAHMDYELKLNKGKSVHRLFSLPNNRLPVYHNPDDEGIQQLLNDTLHHIRIEAYDVYGNKSVLFADIQRKDMPETMSQTNNLERVYWYEGGIFQNGPYRISIPPSSLYNDIYLEIIYMRYNNLLDDTIRIHSVNEPLQKSITIRAVLDSTALQFKDKLIFARINEENIPESEGGECIDSKLITSSRNFGKYFIVPDTVKPTITPVNFIPGGRYIAGQQFTFRVLDDLSGINSYNAFIDGAWVLLKYDAKNDAMIYTIDRERLSSGKDHDLQIEVRDNKGNLAKYEARFYY